MRLIKKQADIFSSYVLDLSLYIEYLQWHYFGENVPCQDRIKGLPNFFRILRLLIASHAMQTVKHYHSESDDKK